MLRIQIYSILIFILSSAQLCSSNDDDQEPCDNTTLSVVTLESEYNCLDTKHQLDINLIDDFTIIRNQTDYDTMVYGDCNPNINFSTYDLLIGKKELNSGNHTIEYLLIKNCETTDLELTVIFNQMDAPIISNLTYHILVPKLIENQTVLVDIEINDLLLDN